MFKLVRLPHTKNVRFETILTKPEIDKMLNELNFDYSKNTLLLDNPEFSSYFKTEYGFKVEHSFYIRNGYVYVDAFADIITEDDKTIVQIEYVATIEALKYFIYYIYAIILIIIPVFIPPVLVELQNSEYTLPLLLILLILFLCTIPQWLPAALLSGPITSLHSKIYWKLKK